MIGAAETRKAIRSSILDPLLSMHLPFACCAEALLDSAHCVLFEEAWDKVWQPLFERQVHGNYAQGRDMIWSGLLSADVPWRCPTCRSLWLFGTDADLDVIFDVDENLKIQDVRDLVVLQHHIWRIRRVGE